MILEVRDLKKTYNPQTQPVQALRGVSFGIKKGQFVAVMGPSGSGKSTLLHLLGGLDRPSQGSVIIDGQDLNKFADHQLSAFRRRRLGFIFQFFNLLPTLTAVENVCLPLMLDGKTLKELQEQAESLMKLIGLGHRLTHRPDQLSGGEMQRVAIARALLSNPAVVLADEPTGNLDSKTGTTVLEILQKMARDQGHTIVMVTHDPRAAGFADRLIKMKDGLVETDTLQTQTQIGLSEGPRA